MLVSTHVCIELGLFGALKLAMFTLVLQFFLKQHLPNFLKLVMLTLI